MTTAAAGGASPEAAFVLGLIPGVGAIYNAEYFKAALHLVIFATLVSLADGTGNAGETLFGFLAFGFYVYMPFEAYYTAKKRKLALEGINLITPFDQLNEQLGLMGNMELWGGILLVSVGVLFLLDNFELVTLAKVKNAALSEDQSSEPDDREQGEAAIVADADVLTANTTDEAAQLERHYGATADQIRIVPPGVDLHTFHPCDQPKNRAQLAASIPK